MIKFEVDKKKSQNNLVKHGIDFLEAQKLWEDADLLEIPAKVKGEPRSIVIGIIAGRVGVTRQSIIKVWLAERLESSMLPTKASSGTR